MLVREGCGEVCAPVAQNGNDKRDWTKNVEDGAGFVSPARRTMGLEREARICDGAEGSFIPALDLYPRTLHQ